MNCGWFNGEWTRVRRPTLFFDDLCELSICSQRNKKVLIEFNTRYLSEKKKILSYNNIT